MSRDTLIKKTIEQLEKLPDHKLQEASDFVEFLVSRINDSLLVEGITEMASTSKTFSFLGEEEIEYKMSDLKERYK